MRAMALITIKRCGTRLWIAIGCLVGLAQAFNPACVQYSYELYSQADIDAIKICQNITGNLQIQSSTIQHINLDGFTYILGDLRIIDSPLLQTISSTTLINIAYDFILDTLPLLSTINFSVPDIQMQSIQWSNLPLLTNPFSTNNSEPRVMLAGIFVSNTSLQTIDSFNLTQNLWQMPPNDGGDGIFIKDNLNLTSAIFTGLDVIKHGIEINSNNPSLKLSFPDLTNGSNTIISNTANVEMPVLRHIDDFTLTNNTFSSFAAPALTTIPGGLLVENNSNLNLINFSNLSSIGYDGLQISNNPSWLSLVGMGVLTEISGKVNITGAFNEISFPSLYVNTNIHDMIDGFYINTTAAKFNCTTFDKAYVNITKKYPQDIMPHYSCEAHVNGATTDSAIHFSGLKKENVLSVGKIVGIVIGSLVVAAILGSLCWIWFNWWKMKRGVVNKVNLEMT